MIEMKLHLFWKYIMVIIQLTVLSFGMVSIGYDTTNDNQVCNRDPINLYFLSLFFPKWK